MHLKAAADQQSRNSRWVDAWRSRKMWRVFLQRWGYWIRIPRTKERKIWMGIRSDWWATVSATSSSGVCFFLVSLACVFASWLPCLLRLCCSESEDSEIRICEFIPATACVLSRVFFFILSSSQDLMHCTLSLTVGLCTPCQQSELHQHNRFLFVGSWPLHSSLKSRPSFDRCRVIVIVCPVLIAVCLTL